MVRRCCFPKSSSRRLGSPSSLLHGLMVQKTGARFRWRHVLGLAVLILVMMALISHPLVPEGTLLHGVMDTVAFMFYLAGLGFRFWATLYVGGRKGSSVIAEGPYSVCRNPLYLGSFFLAIASALVHTELGVCSGHRSPIAFLHHSDCSTRRETNERWSRGGIRSVLPPSSPLRPSFLALPFAARNHCEHKRALDRMPTNIPLDMDPFAR